MLVPTIILCLVSSAFACETYTNASAYFKSSNTFLKDQLKWDTPTPTQANYAALLKTLIDIAQAVKDGATYEDAYAKYADLLAAAVAAPTEARDKLSAIIAEAEKDTQLARDLVEKTCASDASADCDCKVEEAIKADSNLQAQGALLLEFSKSGWGPFQKDWTAAAENNTVGDYLKNNQDKLKAGVEEKAIQLKQMEDIK